MSGAVVLLSLGRHPASGRRRVAEREASAIALAITAGVRPLFVHAGRPEDVELLRPALGMGGDRMELLAIGENEDPLERLAEHLSAAGCDLIVTGTKAEAGEASGLLPFVLAARLEYSLIANVASLAPAAGGWELSAAEPGGMRRLYRARSPLVVTVGTAGPPPHFSAYAAAQRGIITILPERAGTPSAESPGDVAFGASTDDPRFDCPVRPARIRPRPIAGPQADDPSERLLEIIGDKRSSTGHRRVDGSDAAAAAGTVLAEIAAAGCLPTRPGNKEAPEAARAPPAAETTR